MDDLERAVADLGSQMSALQIPHAGASGAATALASPSSQPSDGADAWKIRLAVVAGVVTYTALLILLLRPPCIVVPCSPEDPTKTRIVWSRALALTAAVVGVGFLVAWGIPRYLRTRAGLVG